MSISFNSITLLVTHYKRSGSLERLLKSFADLDISYKTIVVSDDCSPEPHKTKLMHLKSLYNFELITTSQNKGLGNNMNKGQDAITTPFTLYIQEDFVPTSYFKSALKSAVTILEDDEDIDMTHFFGNFKFPYTKKYNDDFSEMLIPSIAADYRKIYMYSDLPHLRRSTFAKKFGRYREGIPGDRTEYWMCMSFIQNGGRALIYNEFKALFDHVNLEDEPSTMQRLMWTQRNDFGLKLLRDTYRQLRYNYDIHFTKAKVDS